MKAFSAPSFSIIKNYVLAWAQTVTGLLVPLAGFYAPVSRPASNLPSSSKQRKAFLSPVSWMREVAVNVPQSLMLST